MYDQAIATSGPLTGVLGPLREETRQHAIALAALMSAVAPAISAGPSPSGVPMPPPSGAATPTATATEAPTERRPERLGERSTIGFRVRTPVFACVRRTTAVGIGLAARRFDASRVDRRREDSPGQRDDGLHDRAGRPGGRARVDRRMPGHPRGGVGMIIRAVRSSA